MRQPLEVAIHVLLGARESAKTGISDYWASLNLVASCAVPPPVVVISAAKRVDFRNAKSVIQR